MDRPSIKPQDIRIFLVDKSPSDNSLLQDMEFSDEELISAMQCTLDRYDTTLPVLNEGYTIETFPYRYEMILGASAYLLKSHAINQTRNRLDYSSSGGTSVQDKNKGPEYLSIAQGLDREFEERIRGLKISKNIRSCWGYVRGPYSQRGYN